MASGTSSKTKERTKYEIDEQNKGLFIVIKQITHRLWFQKQDCGNSEVIPILNYEADEKRILETFNLQRASSNLLIKDDLTNEGGKSFDTFMTEVCNYTKDTEHDPEFVVFCLMSHGFENGAFLLASQGIDGVSEPECCSDQQHSLSGSCFGRHIVSDVIDKLCTSYPDKPKIVLLQCCRGSTVENIEGLGDAANPANSQHELFVPNYPHLFVLRASVEGYVSKVVRRGADQENPDDSKTQSGDINTVKLNGSLLVQCFCDALSNLKNANDQYDSLLDEVRKHNHEKVFNALEQRREDVTDGWVMNVGQQTTELVTYYLIAETILPDTLLGQLLGRKWTEDLKPKTESPDVEVLNQLFREIIKSLEDHQECSQNPKAVGEIIKESSIHAWPMLAYLWANVQRIKPTYPLQLQPGSSDKKKLQLETYLNIIIKEVQHNHQLFMKQQPHISNSMCHKLSCVSILRTEGILKHH